jgi:hypothetical protein
MGLTYVSYLRYNRVCGNQEEVGRVLISVSGPTELLGHDRLLELMVKMGFPVTIEHFDGETTYTGEVGPIMLALALVEIVTGHM